MRLDKYLADQGIGTRSEVKKVSYLKRLSMGPLSLDEKLMPGEFRELYEEEKKLLSVI